MDVQPWISEQIKTSRELLCRKFCDTTWLRKDSFDISWRHSRLPSNPTQCQAQHNTFWPSAPPKALKVKGINFGVLLSFSREKMKQWSEIWMIVKNSSDEGLPVELFQSFSMRGTLTESIFSSEAVHKSKLSRRQLYFSAHSIAPFGICCTHKMSKRIDFLAKARQRKFGSFLRFSILSWKKAFLTIFQIGFYAPEALLYLVVVNDSFPASSCFFP